MTIRKTRNALLALGVALGLAAPAFAAPKVNLTATNNTIAGPGAVAIPTATSFRVFSHPTVGSDVCVTVANTGKFPVSVSIVGSQAGSTDVEPNGSRALCSEDTTAVDLACGEESSCSAQWRIDEN